jgi:hypothetical protein
VSKAHPGFIELHLSAISVDGIVDLPKQFGAQIRALGGRYSECRGDASTGTRFVTLPATHEGGALAVALLQWYPHTRHTYRRARPGSVVIGRPIGAEPVHAHAAIGHESETISKLIGAVVGATMRAGLDALDRAEAERAARPARLRQERASLLARIAAIDAELALSS